MMPEFQKPRARQQHLNAMKVGQTCIDCHKGIAHRNLRDRADEEYLEKLETPNPDFAREVPDIYLASLDRITRKEAEEAAAAKAARERDREAVDARVLAAVEAARAEERAKVENAKASAATATEPAADTQGEGGVAADVNWKDIAGANLHLFYPRQASFEWVQNGKTTVAPVR